jgi:hypothetical protein
VTKQGRGLPRRPPLSTGVGRAGYRVEERLHACARVRRRNGWQAGEREQEAGLLRKGEESGFRVIPAGKVVARKP